MGVPLQTVPLHAQREWFVELEQLGYTDLWSNEAYGVDGFTPLALASCWAPSLRLGCACHPVQTRGPAILAQSAAGLAQAAPGRFVLGIGASSPTVVESWNAQPYEKPYQRMRDGLRFLRAALAGDRVDEQYETFSVRRFRLAAPCDPPPPLFVAALRPQMLRLAGREGDGVILNWISVDDVERVTSIVHDAAGHRETESVLRIMVLPGTDLASTREVARYAVAGTLTVPAYRAHQEWLGRSDQLAAMWSHWERGDRKAALAAIPESLLDALIIAGPVERCREQIERYFEAGIDTMILEVGALPGDAMQAARDLAP